MTWSFWQRSQYGQLEERDVGRLPAELNFYLSFWLRLASAETVACLCIVAGVAFGLFCVWLDVLLR